MNTIRMAHSRRRPRKRHVPVFVADFTLRAVISDVDDLAAVRELALALPLP